MTDAGAALAGMPSTAVWHAARHFNYMFEIDIDAVAGLLPRRLAPVEPRIGTALLNVGYMRLLPGTMGIDETFDELTVSVQVHPDLSLSMPMPRFAFYDIRIGSNSRAFLDFETIHQKLPVMHLPTLDSRLGHEGRTLDVRDAEGPIFRFANTHPDPMFKREHIYGQYFSMCADVLYQGVFAWEGIACEHQYPGPAGELFAHPLFRGLALDQYRPYVYMQTFLAHAVDPATFRSYSPRPIV